MSRFFEKKRERFLMVVISLVVIIFFSNPVLAGRDAVSYEWSKLNVEGTGGILLMEIGPNPSVEYMTANMTFFPKNYGDTQSIVDQKFQSSPDSEVMVQGESAVYTWDKPPLGNINFGFNSQLLNQFNFVKVTNKISFPAEINRYEFRDYLSSTNLIYPDDLETKRIANQLVSGEDDFYSAIHKIAVWVNANVKYTSNDATAEVSKDSKWVLENKIGVCDEITNLFVAMVRSIGVPAKFVSGMAYSNQMNNFGNHAWTEVYFQGVGWVPFDVTYGEYGFVDSTHIKFRDGMDGSPSSVDYLWRGRDVDAKINGFSVNASMADHSSSIEWNFEVNVQPLKNELGRGSYVPVMMEVKNNEPYYLPINLYTIKAPTATVDTKFSLLVPPLSTKKVFTITQLPLDLREGYIYTSTFEVTDFFEGMTASNVINYGNQNDYYSYENAKLMISNLQEEQVSYSSELVSNCTFDREVYYPSDMMMVNCNVENNGNVNINSVKACIKNQCKSFELFIAENKKLSFDILLTNDLDELILDLEYDGTKKHEYFGVKVYPEPDLRFTELKVPVKMSYDDMIEFKFNITVDSPVKNVFVDMCGKNFFSIDNLKGRNDFMIPIEGSFFYGKDCEIKVSYENLKGDKHEKSTTLPIEVIDVPFYAEYTLVITIFWILLVSSLIIIFIKKKMKHSALISAPHKRNSHRARKDLDDIIPHKNPRKKF